MQESLDNLMELLVTVEISGVDLSEPWIVEAKRFEELGQSSLTEAEEYIFEVEDSELDNANERIIEVRIQDLNSSLNSFKDSLKTPASKIIQDVVEIKQTKAIHEIITQKRDQMSSFKSSKITICSEVSKDMFVDELQKLNELYVSIDVMFNDWVEAAIKLCPQESSNPQHQHNSGTQITSKEPGLKIDRLALPIFKGNVRGFARFMKDFESTVGLQFTDPKVKVMYLQNQCLSGYPKELVRGLTEYDEVVTRLKERYGNPSLTIDCVLREISDLKFNHSDEQSSIIKLCRVLQSAWDDLAAVDSIDEFCNIVTLNTLESKLPPKLQVQWAREKIRKNLEASKECMPALKSFLEEQRKVASNVLLMRGKVDAGSTGPSHGDPKPKFNGAISIAESRPRGCFRCGYTSHRIKDCKIPGSFKCRKCHRVGHIENACPEKVRNDESSKGGAQGNEPFKGGKGDEPPKGIIKEVKFNGSLDFSGSDFDQQVVKLPIEQINTSKGPCTVLWDSGSMLNLISTEWADKVGLVGKNVILITKLLIIL